MGFNEEKMRRMELRRKNGTRKTNEWPQSKETNRSPTHSSYVCFSCREAPRFPPIEKTRQCNKCGSDLSVMGPTFKVPRKSNNKQWQKVELLYLHGERFGSYGREVPLPKTLAEAKIYVKEIPKNLTPPK